MQRRDFMKLTLSGIVLAALSPLLKTSKAFAQATLEKLSKTNEEWKKLLTTAQYNVLREEGTERPFTSALL